LGQKETGTTVNKKIGEGAIATDVEMAEQAGGSAGTARGGDSKKEKANKAARCGRGTGDQEISNFPKTRHDEGKKQHTEIQ